MHKKRSCYVAIIAIAIVFAFCELGQAGGKSTESPPYLSNGLTRDMPQSHRLGRRCPQCGRTFQLPTGRTYYNGRYYGNLNNRFYGPQYGYF